MEATEAISPKPLPKNRFITGADINAYRDALEKNGIPFDVRHAPEDLSLEKAISDTRKQENLHGPYSSAQEAVASMLED